MIIFGHLFEFDHDEDNHGKDVEDHQKARTDSDGQVVPVLVNFNTLFHIISYAVKIENVKSDKWQCSPCEYVQ